MLIVVAVVLLLVLPGPWDVVGFAIALGLGFVELYLWHRTVRRRLRVVGPQTLLGREAVVVTPCDPDGQVRVDGEIWAAHCAAGARIGDSVRIAARRSLVLTVEPIIPPG